MGDLLTFDELRFLVPTDQVVHQVEWELAKAHLRLPR